jgi:hypothetical protein
VNLHAGFALGTVLLVLFLAGESLERFRSTAPAAGSSTRPRDLALALLLNLLLIPLNPNGARMYLYPIHTLLSKAMQSYISEWASPNFHRTDYLPFLLLLLAVFTGLAWSRRSVRLRDLILLLVSMFAALSSIRMIPFLVLIAVPLVARATETCFDDRGFDDQWFGHRSPTGIKRHPALNAVMLAAMAGFVAVHCTVTFRQQSQAEAARFPAAATAFLAAHPSEGPIFNHYDWGGYLIWKLYPPTRVFIDGRADVYGEAILKDFMQTYLLNQDWQHTLTRWQIRTVVVPPDSALASGLRNQTAWSVQYEDPQAVIFASQIDSGRLDQP